MCDLGKEGTQWVKYKLIYCWNGNSLCFHSPLSGRWLSTRLEPSCMFSGIQLLMDFLSLIFHLEYVGSLFGRYFQAFYICTYVLEYITGGAYVY
jgi:hypothetical protein